MNTAAELRRQVESALAERIPAALSFRPPVSPEMLSCGLTEVDDALGGGLPLGAITELTGVHSSGRTTLALSALAEVTRRGESCAYVDISDALNPISASALGVALRRLLWVRVGEVHAEEAAVADTGHPAAMPVQAPSGENLGGGAGRRHPRNEAVGLHQAVHGLFHAPHQERGDFTPRCAEAIRRERVEPVVFSPRVIPPSRPMPRPRNLRRKISWTQLDQALLATDLLLSTGGFRALVLDMGDVTPEQARCVPLATWYRFRLQAEKSRTLFLLLTRVACANSCAAVSLHCRQDAIEWQQAALHSPRLLAGLHYRVSVERVRAAERTRKKPAASTAVFWRSTTPWSR